MKLQEAKGRYFITIPKDLVSLKGWVKHDELILMINENNNIEILKKEIIKKETVGLNFPGFIVLETY